MSSTFISKDLRHFETAQDNNEIFGVDNLTIPNKQKRIPELDGLRGIAVLMVVAFHYINNQLVNANSHLGKIFYKLTSVGWVGVDLFFVLSGFLIGTILMNNKAVSYTHLTLPTILRV